MRRGDQQKGLRGAVLRREELRKDEQAEGLPQLQRWGRVQDVRRQRDYTLQPTEERRDRRFRLVSHRRRVCIHDISSAGVKYEELA